jgi:hypothetical protein
MGLNLIDNNKYIFDIPIPFCHHLYLSATFKQCFTEFEGTELGFHIVYMCYLQKMYLQPLSNVSQNLKALNSASLLLNSRYMYI